MRIEAPSKRHEIPRRLTREEVSQLIYSVRKRLAEKRGNPRERPGLSREARAFSYRNS